MSPDPALRSSESFSSLPLRSSDDLRTQRMWEGVPPEVFERAPSTVGKFEQVETELVARLLAQHVALEGGALHLLGCGTAFREVDTLLQARAIEVERRLKVHPQVLSGDGPTFVVPRLKPINALIGYDFAAQFLEVAARRLSELAELGVTDSARTELCSLEQVELQDRLHGVALLGVYDVDCLIGKALDGKESVGLEEYGCGMREILGAHIQLAPLIVEGDSLKDLAGGLCFRSDAPEFESGFDCIRAKLLQMRAVTPQLAGIRVRIQKEPFGPQGELAESCFTSTWFDLNRITSFLREQHGIEVSVVRGESVKGAVLMLRGAHQTLDKSEHCALMMNNVLGNLGSDATLNSVIKRLARFVAE